MAHAENTSLSTFFLKYICLHANAYAKTQSQLLEFYILATCHNFYYIHYIAHLKIMCLIPVHACAYVKLTFCTLSIFQSLTE